MRSTMKLGLLFAVYAYVNAENFVYRDAPSALTTAAEKLGRTQREIFEDAVSKTTNGEERLQLYAEGLSTCSSLGTDMTKHLELVIGSLSPQPAEGTSAHRVQRILEATGVDSVSRNFYTMPPSQMAETVRTACLKNELQFHCAYGFFGDANEIQEHIRRMKLRDGSMKVMFENECKDPESAPLLYTCVTSNAEEILRQCEHSIAAYNNTRREINGRMQWGYNDAMERIDNTLANLPSGTPMDHAVRKGDEMMTETLALLQRLEAFKCRQQAIMEHCVLKVSNSVCGPVSTNNLKTIMRVGSLRRDRGEELNAQFLELGVSPHRACQEFV